MQFTQTFVTADLPQQVWSWVTYNATSWSFDVQEGLNPWVQYYTALTEAEYNENFNWRELYRYWWVETSDELDLDGNPIQYWTWSYQIWLYDGDTYTQALNCLFVRESIYTASPEQTNLVTPVEEETM